MKKISYLLFAAFITMSHFNVYADVSNDTGTRPLDITEKMEIDWAAMAQPVTDVFKTEKDINIFLDVLFDFCKYDKERSVVMVSMEELYAVCIVATEETKHVKTSTEQKNQCMDLSIAITANILGKDELRARNDAAKEEKDANDIYEIQSVSRKDGSSFRTAFSLKLQSFMVNKYCRENTAVFNCYPVPEMQCNLVENTKYLERDLRLTCDRSNWVTYYENGKYIIRLKRE